MSLASHPLATTLARSEVFRPGGSHLPGSVRVAALLPRRLPGRAGRLPPPATTSLPVVLAGTAPVPRSDAVPLPAKHRALAPSPIIYRMEIRHR